MTKNATKKALLTSALSLLLCLSMLVGTTFAWFTDTASTNINKIQAGELDIALEVATAWDADGNPTAWENAEGKTLDFKKAANAPKDEAILWEPGCTYELPQLRIVNNGDLHLKYTLTITGIDGDAKLNDAIVWTYGDYTVGTDYVTLAPKATSAVMTIKGHMKEDAGNEYQGLTIDGISITVFATQVEAEYDSFGNQYDADAPALVSIGGKSYKTLNEAIEDAEANSVITVGGNVEYVIGEGSNLTIDLKGVTLVATEENPAVVTISGNGTNNTLTNATLKNLTVVDTTTSYADGSWEFGYLEMENITAKDVVFANGIMLDGINSFTNCTFTGKTESGLNMYGAWVNAGTSTFTGCTFTGTRGLKAHEAYGSEIATVTVEGCAFNAMSEKPGIAFGDLNADTTVTLKNNTFTDTQPGDGAYIKNHGVPYQYETDTDVTTFTFVAENNNTIINVYTVADLWAVTNVSNCITENGTVDRTNVPAYNMAEVTINIMADLDMGDAWWRPICQYPSSESIGGFAGTINGNGHTISNFKSSGNRTVDNSTMLDNGWGHCQGLIGIASGCTVKDLTFVNATVVSQNSLVGTIIGNSNGNNTVDNCHVIGMTAESNYYIAGIIGRAANGDAITNCSVKDVTVKSWYATNPENYSGALYGSISTYDHDGDSTTDKIKGTVDVEGSTWENVVVQYVADTDSDGVKEVISSVAATH